MSKQITTIDEETRLNLPQEAIEALGVQPGDKVNVEVIGRAVIVRSVADAARAEDFAQSFESILQRRRSAYDQLAEGAK